MKLHSGNESETRGIGRRLGEKLNPGDIVCLYGELGAGKTTMVKGIASAIGIDERDIGSASFIIIAEHAGMTKIRGETVPFYHIDLYRLDPEDIGAIGLHEYLGGDGISVIEWAERAESEIPEGAIRARFYYTGEDSREIEIEGVEL